MNPCSFIVSLTSFFSGEDPPRLADGASSFFVVRRCSTISAPWPHLPVPRPHAPTSQPPRAVRTASQTCPCPACKSRPDSRRRLLRPTGRHPVRSLLGPEGGTHTARLLACTWRPSARSIHHRSPLQVAAAPCLLRTYRSSRKKMIVFTRIALVR